LGHSQIAVRMTTYGHVMPPEIKDAAARMDSLFSKAL
jgi:integrase